ncbi:MAG: Pr6Pr family membrane protein [Lachnospira sp.]|nr:Pr6Pr family membrane protein [Lachnospira sp.]
MSTKVEFNKTHLVISIILKTISLIASVYGLCLMIDSLKSFTFFTTLSNVAIDIILAVFLVMDIILLATGKNYKNNTLYIIKFLMTLSITLTFLVYLVILAPTSKDGFIGAYMNNGAGSLGVHFVGPVLAIIDFLLFDKGFNVRKIYAIYAVIPPLCYVAFVYILAAAGMRWDGGMCAPYNFLNYNAVTGWFGWNLSTMGTYSIGIGVAYMIVVLLLLFIGIGLLYLAINGAGRKDK